MGYYGDWGYGMMSGWGFGWIGWIMMIVWTIVGILAVIWLWRHIRK